MSAAPGFVLDYAQAAPVRLVWLLAGWLPVRWATALGAALGAAIGPRLSKHKKVVRNLRIVLKSASEHEVGVVARRSWRNVGALLAELPHLRNIARSRVELDVAPEVQALIEAREPILILSAHIANWEVLPFVVADLGCPLSIAYTPDRNPFIDRKLQSMRAGSGCGFMAKKDAVPRMFRATKQRASFGVLADVRVDSGTLVPLFGVETSTTLTAVRIALRAGYPVVPFYVERLPRSRFRIHGEAPLNPAGELEGEAAAMDVMLKYHRSLERRILAQPADWLCTKRRWPKPGRA